MKQSEDTPHNIEERNSPIHWDIGEQNQKRELANYCTDGVEGLKLDELITVEAEVFFHARNVGTVFLLWTIGLGHTERVMLT